MFQWRDIPSLIQTAVGRFYGLFFVTIGALFLYWTGRGIFAYMGGIRAAWSDPTACAAGVVAGVLSIWAGVHVLRGGIPAAPMRFRRGTSPELESTLEEAMKLERSDPGAAHQLLESYFMREAATTDARREDLRRRAPSDVKAAIQLRRELAEERANNAEIKKEILTAVSADVRDGMLAEVEATDRALQSEIDQLDRAIQQGKLE